jgi:hypothetical protein
MTDYLILGVVFEVVVGVVGGVIVGVGIGLVKSSIQTTAPT